MLPVPPEIFKKLFPKPFQALKALFLPVVKIVFFGTPEFAVVSLQKIIEAGFDVRAVVTSPDRPQGRGLKVQYSAVKEYALTQNLPILQPLNLKSPEFQETLRSYGADIFVIIAFRMLPLAVWSMPPLGSINLHASLLPDYRGAAPINHAIINGETETGVTTFFLKHEIDTGDIIMQEKVKIFPGENAGELHDKLMYIGAEVMVKTLQKIRGGSYETIPQRSSVGNVKTAPKLSKEFGRLDWNEEVTKLYNKIRGLSPYPAAWTTLDGQQLKIFSGEVEENVKSKPGEILSDGKTYLKIGAQGGYFVATEIQLEGKKRMKTADFLRGYPVSENTRID